MLEKQDISKVKKNLLEQLESQKDALGEEYESIKNKIEALSDKDIEEMIKKECLFCKIASEQVESIKVYESKNIIAVMDINPVKEGQIIVLAKEHEQFIFNLSNRTINEIFNVVSKIIPLIMKNIGCLGVSIYIPQGIDQNLNHFSVNLIPRFKDDGENVVIFWKRKKSDREKIKKISESIKEELNKEMKKLKLNKLRKIKKIEINKQNETSSISETKLDENSLNYLKMLKKRKIA